MKYSGILKFSGNVKLVTVIGSPILAVLLL